MNLEMARITDVSECFYGKLPAQPANDLKFNDDGTIAYQAVEGFKSTLGNIRMYQEEREEEKDEENTNPKNDLGDNERDVDSRVYSNKVSISLISKIIVEKYQRKRDVREIYFSIKNCRQQVSVHATIRDGIISCTLSSASENLRRKLQLGSREMIAEIRLETRLHMYVSVTDEIIFGRA